MSSSAASPVLSSITSVTSSGRFGSHACSFFSCFRWEMAASGVASSMAAPVVTATVGSVSFSFIVTRDKETTPPECAGLRIWW
ncbi:hypothetical protein BDV24DRAFT_127182 [Aspergillus arachidicola]|uniref:Uncharacterized protein n=1 Tax=Aspergillus arachidicola TaxID=656916 RepID=A0A5N6YHL9_9EURO|nr:hypothetical protein BDV24DRAFT_127182 [Aspergillus arachidicola]